MARYYFDFYDGSTTVDEEGLELPDYATMRNAAMDALPKIAAEQISEDGDHQVFVIVVRDESGRHMYTATLSYIGLRLAI